MNVTADPDSRVRDAQMRIEGPDGTTYHALPLLAAARQVRADLTKATLSGDRLVVPAPLGERVLPLDQRGGMAVYYASAPATSHDPAAGDWASARSRASSASSR